MPSINTRDGDDPLARSFANFLWVAVDYMGWDGKPTPAQLELAKFMQYGWHHYYPEVDPMAKRNDIIMAFRGFGKSDINAAYALWRLYRNPRSEKLLIVSASKDRADSFVSQCKSTLLMWPILKHLRPRPDQRNRADRFDVNGASPSQSASLRAAGIEGQITGSRATCIVGDDVEIPDNSRSEEGRENLVNKTQEFDDILMPAQYDEDGNITIPGGDAIMLGTPQTQESVYYKKIIENDYKAWVWPVEYPKPDKWQNYIIQRPGEGTTDLLAPPLRDVLDEDPDMAGKRTDPERWSREEIINRGKKAGKLRWLLQWMLDVSVSDEERYPLKERDLMVMALHPEIAPRMVQWGRDSDRHNLRTDLRNHGFTGDFWMGPLFKSGQDEWRAYDQAILYVDTSGRGRDETSWCVLKSLNGVMYLLGMWGMTAADARKQALRRKVKEGIDEYDIRMEEIAKCAKKYNVSTIFVETNFADGLWIKSFQPILANVWPPKTLSEPGGCTVEEVRVSGQKEVRILDALEPVFLNHRLVVDESVARDQAFVYQMTHLTRDPGALRHDDRIDCLAGAVESIGDTMELSVREQASAQREAELDKELDDFLELMEEGGLRQRAKRRPGDEPGQRTNYRWGM